MFKRIMIGLLATLCACAGTSKSSMPKTATASKPPLAPPAPQTAPAAAQPEAKEEVADAPKSDKSLYDRLGGLPAIEAVVTEFTHNVAADERINAPFGVTDLDTLHKHLVEFFCVATGGPCQYHGRDMKASHTNMGVTTEQFNILVGALVKSLDKFNVPEREKGEILAALGPLKKDIVEVE